MMIGLVLRVCTLLYAIHDGEFARLYTPAKEESR